MKADGPVGDADDEAAATHGTFTVAFRLMPAHALQAERFDFGRDLVLRLSMLLPDEMRCYEAFAGIDELNLNFMAWKAALGILIPDVLELLGSTR